MKVSHVNRKCASATAAYNRQVADVDFRYVYEPHVVVVHRDDNNRARPVLVPVGGPIQVSENTVSSWPSLSSVAVPNPELSQQQHRLQRRPTTAAIFNVESGRQNNAIANVDQNSIPTAFSSLTPNTVGASSSAARVGSTLADSRQRMFADPTPISTSSNAVDSVEEGGAGLDIQLTQLIASVDSLHIPSARKEKMSSSLTKTKIRRSMQTILADLERSY